MPLSAHFSRTFTNLLGQCSSPSKQVIFLSIDDITRGDDELLLGTGKGGPVAMLKWAKGSKHGGSGHGSAARVSLADLRRASARLLRRKDSSSKKHSPPAAKPDLVIDNALPPVIPPRCSSNVSNSSSGSESTGLNVPAAAHQEGVIKQATVRRMSTLRQTATQPAKDEFHSLRRSGRSKSRDKSIDTNGDASDGGNSSLYMQLDKIPVAVQCTAANKRKVLEDISNQAYRHIIHSLQEELAQLTADEEGTRLMEQSADTSLLPLAQMDTTISEAHDTTLVTKEASAGDNPSGQRAADGMASFTNVPPANGELHRPRPVRHASPPASCRSSFVESSACCSSPNHLTSDAQPSTTGGSRGEFSSLTGKHSRPMPPLGYHFCASPVKKICHTSTGQHLHMNCPPRPLSAANSLNVMQLRPANASAKKNRPAKSVTFQTDVRLKSDQSPSKLAVVFETEQEEGSLRRPKQSTSDMDQDDGEVDIKDSASEPLIPGFVNIPCSRRGFCEFDSDLVKLETEEEQSCPVSKTTQGNNRNQCDLIKAAAELKIPPDGYDWQPSYVNLEDTEIAPVLLASSRPIDESHDFWKPRSVASGDNQSSFHADTSPVYDSPKTEDNPLLEFPFRYGGILPANAGRHSMSNSSGSDTQDSGVAELAQPLSFSRAASASPMLASGSHNEDFLLSGNHQPFYNTLPRSTDNKRTFWSREYPSIYDNTDPHFLSAAPSSAGGAPPSQFRFPPALQDPTSVDVVDHADASWSSDHLYCNMASVDPLPLLPPRMSRRCHSLLGLTTAASEDADYENVDVNQTASKTYQAASRLNISHSRSRSLRHSGDFSPFIPQSWEAVKLAATKVATATASPRQQQHLASSKEPIGQLLNVVRSRRDQLNYERQHRLQRMLNDPTFNDYSDIYEPSDWSTEAILSDTVRDLDALSLDGKETKESARSDDAAVCRCLSQYCAPICTKCNCSQGLLQPVVFISKAVCLGEVQSMVCQCPCSLKSTAGQKMRETLQLACAAARENAATQTESGSSLARAAAAENPLYMAYNDLTKIDDFDPVTMPATPAVARTNDYLSDGCETWNSHKALYARIKLNQVTEEDVDDNDQVKFETPQKRRTRKRRQAFKSTPSSGRIWRHDGKSVSTPSKNRGGKSRARLRFDRSANASIYSNIRDRSLANSDLLDRTAQSTRSTRSSRSTRRNGRRKSRAADVLHGKGQLQLSIYLNSGLLTLHVISGRNLKSSSGKLCNTYVKIALIPDSLEKTFCRTTLIKNDNSPWFDQKFSFEFLSADLYKRLVISVWNRDVQKNRSEFLGCMSFSVSHVIRKDTSGWYRLLNANIGRQRHFAVRKQTDLIDTTFAEMQEAGEYVDDEDLVVVDDSDDLNETEKEEPMQDQPDAESTAKDTQLAPKAAQDKEDHKSGLHGNGKGKTPYTLTMKLQKGPKGYGFSVTWTHPPRIERVEPGLSADSAGMRVGDYIVFVGSQNVVKMAEEQVLQLIQSAGDTLTLEIYRKTSQTSNMTSEQLTMAELQPSPALAVKSVVVAHNDTDIFKDVNERRVNVTNATLTLTAPLRAKHALMNAESALALAVHRVVIALNKNPDRGKLLTHFEKLEVMTENHVERMMNTIKVRQLNIVPLIHASELHKLKTLLDLTTEGLPFIAVSQASSDDDILCEQLRSITMHLRDILSFLRTINQYVKDAERVDYFLEAFQNSLAKLEEKVKERAASKSQPKKSHVEEMMAKLPQNIVYSAKIRQPKLHWSTNDGHLLHRGLLWKKEEKKDDEIRYMALLFSDVLLLTNVNNGIHFVEEDPVFFRNVVRLLSSSDQSNATFRLVVRSQGLARMTCSDFTFVTLRAKDWALKVSWTDLIHQQINTWFDYPRRMRCLSQQSLSVKEVKIFHQIHRCLSCSILNVSDDQETASSYHRYSCEDLYDGALEQDPIGATTPNSRRSASPISPAVKWPRQSNVRSATQSTKLHHSDIADADDDLNNKFHREEASGSRAWKTSSASAQLRKIFPHRRMTKRSETNLATTSEGSSAKDGTIDSGGVVGDGNNSSGVYGPPTGTVHPAGRLVSASVSNVLHRTADCMQAWAYPVRNWYLNRRLRFSANQRTAEIATVTISLANPHRTGDQSAISAYQSAPGPESGDSSEMSPSWASASSSALETPNDPDHQLAFDFSKQCDVNGEANKQSAPTKSKVCISMPTTPVTAETSPSPRQTSASTGFFRFPFVGNSSPRKFRSRTMSAEVEGQAPEESPSPNTSTSNANEVKEGATDHPVSSSKLRFPRFLRRTHSASYANPRDVPPYALFLRAKRPVSKTRSAEMSTSPQPSEAISPSSPSGEDSEVGCKTRLSEMKLRLGFLRRRSTESSITTVRPQPHEAQKWATSFADLMASKYGAALYRAFLEREFSNENLEFWLACEDYKSVKPQKMASKAQKIYNDFVAVQAPKEVNLDSETRVVTLNGLQSNNLDRHLFDRAQRRIQNIMERDSYLRFLQSDLFLELIHPERYQHDAENAS